MPVDELGIRLLRAESENEVTDIVAAAESTHRISWHPVDQRDTNFNVVQNQAASGGKALTELCTNMVDAILLRHAYQGGIDPRSAEAPQSVIQAVRDLVKLRGARSGILAEVDDPNELRHYAEENLVIGVTGDRTHPCFTFVDSGEGQRPDNFDTTFLSLSERRKSDIPFVQGKYNMGSAGVLSFCGRRWYKLIISRRYDGTSRWGWTLVRRWPGEGTPYAQYLKIDGRIPELAVTRIQPFTLRDGSLDSKVGRATGTVVKLYSYELGRAANFRTVREALNENLISSMLPFRLMDFRVAPSKTRGGRRALGVDERTLNGMDFQLRRLDAEEDEPSELGGDPLHVANLNHPELGAIVIHAVPLPRSLPDWLKASRNNMRVYHAVNGQVQFKQSRGFLSRQCRLPGLKDRIVIIVDASDLSDAAHHVIWKGDRETVLHTSMGNLYVNEVRDAIRQSRILREYQDRIARQETEQLARETQSDLFQSIVSTDPHIAQLLPGGSVVHMPSIGPRFDEVGKKYVGKYHPTFVTLRAAALRASGVDMAVGQSRRIRFETDVQNEWLTRPDNRGRVRLSEPASGAFSIRTALNDGSLAVTVQPLPDKVSLSQTFDTELVLSDDAMPLPVSAALTLIIVPERPVKPPGPPSRRRRAVEDDTNDTVETRGLPRTQWLTADGRAIGDDPSEPWPEGFSDQDGGIVEALTDTETIYKINYDNAHFRHFVNREPNGPRAKVVTEQYRMSLLVLMMGFEDAYSRLPESRITEELEDLRDEYRRIAAQGAATVVMSIAQTISKLINVETVGDPDDD